MILFLSLYSSAAFYSEVLLHVCWGWRIFLSADLLQMLYFQLTWALRVVPLHRSSVQAAGYGWMLTGRWMWWLKKSGNTQKQHNCSSSIVKPTLEFRLPSVFPHSTTSDKHLISKLQRFKDSKIQDSKICVFLFEERQNQRHTIGTHQPLSVGFETNVKWHGDGKQLHRYKEQDKAVNPEVCWKKTPPLLPK